MTSSLRDLKVYTTYPHSCSYLRDQEATTLFIDPRQEVDQHLYSSLSTLGFRRSGNHVYRPHCGQCKACIPARIPVQDFQPRRNQRRSLRQNRDLSVERTADIRDNQAYHLYQRYIEQRHADGDMFPPDREQYESFLNNAWDCTRYYRFYDHRRLLAVAVVDVMIDGLSAIYTFFDPDEQQRGLGSYAILWQIEQAREMGLHYLYLGYWIEACKKMAYKADYQPLELLLDNRWRRLAE
ncbi:arginyltransferase [Parahaliea aestuarii]|uniref:Aspartate/glutamate leucyltransferase n=1 Tax=Parahaliea aestuarii TaxID=1852021 RepID=A0A5C9A0M0_9GAMM|nr:arginyltransferase [Parahaliea aestuarii]TXS93147.1 arginyltransferase [Parahaliea aestuarii]